MGLHRFEDIAWDAECGELAFKFVPPLEARLKVAQLAVDLEYGFERRERRVRRWLSSSPTWGAEAFEMQLDDE